MNEREADIYGAWYAFQAGYDLDRGVAVWERLAGVDEKDPFLTTYFLASHPAPTGAPGPPEADQRNTSRPAGRRRSFCKPRI